MVAAARFKAANFSESSEPSKVEKPSERNEAW
jgi:hypothetical protein